MCKKCGLKIFIVNYMIKYKIITVSFYTELVSKDQGKPGFANLITDVIFFYRHAKALKAR